MRGGLIWLFWFMVYLLSARRERLQEKTKRNEIRLMFGLLHLRRFWAITSINTAKPCHSFLSLFHAKHRAARDQWPVQLLCSSFVSPPHWKRKQSLHFLNFIAYFYSFPTSDLLPLHPLALVFRFLTPWWKPFPPPSWCCSSDTFAIVFHHIFSLEDSKKILGISRALARLATLSHFPWDWVYISLSKKVCFQNYFKTQHS